MISAGVLAVFATGDFAWCADLAAPPQAAPASIRSALPDRASDFDLPADSVSLREFHRGTNGKTIIHIQDAHANLSGQESLARSLDHLMTRYGVSLVLVEGGSGDASLTELRDIASPEEWAVAAKRFLYDGVISGEEYLNLTSDHPMRLAGIEDPELYRESLAVYARLIERRAGILDYLRQARRAVDRLKNSLYPRELLAYESRQSAGFAESVGILADLASQAGLEPDPAGALRRLGDIRKTEKKLDFERANAEQARLLERLAGRGGDVRSLAEAARRASESPAARSGAVERMFAEAGAKGIETSDLAALREYASYLKSFAEFEWENLIEESEDLADRVYAAKLTGDAPAVRAIDRLVTLLESAYSLRMSSREFARLKVLSAEWPAERWQGFLNRKLSEAGDYDELVPFEPVLEQAVPDLRAFYGLVERRDGSFLANAKRELESSGQSAAFLIAGGYHTEHLTRLLRESGFSYFVLTPVVKTETDQSRYEKMLLSGLRNPDERSETVRLAAAPDSRSSGIRGAPFSENGLNALEEAYGPRVPVPNLSPDQKQELVRFLSRSGAPASGARHAAAEPEGIEPIGKVKAVDDAWREFRMSGELSEGRRQELQTLGFVALIGSFDEIKFKSRVLLEKHFEGISREAAFEHMSGFWYALENAKQHAGDRAALLMRPIPFRGQPGIEWAVMDAGPGFVDSNGMAISILDTALGRDANMTTGKHHVALNWIFSLQSEQANVKEVHAVGVNKEGSYMETESNGAKVPDWDLKAGQSEVAAEEPTGTLIVARDFLETKKRRYTLDFPSERVAELSMSIPEALDTLQKPDLRHRWRMAAVHLYYALPEDVDALGREELGKLGIPPDISDKLRLLAESAGNADVRQLALGAVEKIEKAAPASGARYSDRKKLALTPEPRGEMKVIEDAWREFRLTGKLSPNQTAELKALGFGVKTGDYGDMRYSTRDFLEESIPEISQSSAAFHEEGILYALENAKQHAGNRMAVIARPVSLNGKPGIEWAVMDGGPGFVDSNGMVISSLDAAMKRDHNRETGNRHKALYSILHSFSRDLMIKETHADRDRKEGSYLIKKKYGSGEGARWRLSRGFVPKSPEEPVGALVVVLDELSPDYFQPSLTLSDARLAKLSTSVPDALRILRDPAQRNKWRMASAHLWNALPREADRLTPQARAKLGIPADIVQVLGEILEFVDNQDAKWSVINVIEKFGPEAMPLFGVVEKYMGHKELRWPASYALERMSQGARVKIGDVNLGDDKKFSVAERQAFRLVREFSRRAEVYIDDALEAYLNGDSADARGVPSRDILHELVVAIENPANANQFVRHVEWTVDAIQRIMPENAEWIEMNKVRLIQRMHRDYRMWARERSSRPKLFGEKDRVGGGKGTNVFRDRLADGTQIAVLIPQLYQVESAGSEWQKRRSAVFQTYLFLHQIGIYNRLNPLGLRRDIPFTIGGAVSLRNEARALIEAALNQADRNVPDGETWEKFYATFKKARHENHRIFSVVQQFFPPSRTLAEALPRMTERQKLLVLRQIARTLQYVHSKGILHRDIKADNVLLTDQLLERAGWDEPDLWDPSMPPALDVRRDPQPVVLSDWAFAVEDRDVLPAVESAWGYNPGTENNMPFAGKAPQISREQMFSDQRDLFAFGLMMAKSFGILLTGQMRQESIDREIQDSALDPRLKSVLSRLLQKDLAQLDYTLRNFDADVSGYLGAAAASPDFELAVPGEPDSTEDTAVIEAGARVRRQIYGEEPVSPAIRVDENTPLYVTSAAVTLDSLNKQTLPVDHGIHWRVLKDGEGHYVQAFYGSQPLSDERVRFGADDGLVELGLFREGEPALVQYLRTGDQSDFPERLNDEDRKSYDYDLRRISRSQAIIRQIGENEFQIEDGSGDRPSRNGTSWEGALSVGAAGSAGFMIGGAAYRVTPQEGSVRVDVPQGTHFIFEERLERLIRMTGRESFEFIYSELSEGQSVLISIGRTGQIVPNSTQVSRDHAVLQFRSDGSVRLEDMDSRNGTFLSGERIRAAELVPPFAGARANPLIERAAKMRMALPEFTLADGSTIRPYNRYDEKDSADTLALNGATATMNVFYEMRNRATNSDDSFAYLLRGPDGKLLGMLYYALTSANEVGRLGFRGVPERPVLRVGGIALQPATRGSGLGRVLMAAAAAVSRASKATGRSGDVLVTAAIPIADAQRDPGTFYGEALGMERLGPVSYFGGGDLTKQWETKAAKDLGLAVASVPGARVETYIPAARSAGEVQSWAAEHALNAARERGIQPNVKMPTNATDGDESEGVSLAGLVEFFAGEAAMNAMNRSVAGGSDVGAAVETGTDEIRIEISNLNPAGLPVENIRRFALMIALGRYQMLMRQGVDPEINLDNMFEIIRTLGIEPGMTEPADLAALREDLRNLPMRVFFIMHPFPEDVGANPDTALDGHFGMLTVAEFLTALYPREERFFAERLLTIEQRDVERADGRAERRVVVSLRLPAAGLPPQVLEARKTAPGSADSQTAVSPADQKVLSELAENAQRLPPQMFLGTEAGGAILVTRDGRDIRVGDETIRKNLPDVLSVAALPAAAENAEGPAKADVEAAIGALAAEAKLARTPDKPAAVEVSLDGLAGPQGSRALTFLLKVLKRIAEISDGKGYIGLTARSEEGKSLQAKVLRENPGVFGIPAGVTGALLTSSVELNDPSATGRPWRLMPAFKTLDTQIESPDIGVEVALGWVQFLYAERLKDDPSARPSPEYVELISRRTGRPQAEVAEVLRASALGETSDRKVLDLARRMVLPTFRVLFERALGLASNIAEWVQTSL